MKILSETEIEQKLKSLNNWTSKENAIQRNFEFKNFSQSLAFIVQIGLHAEKLNHHPEIYNVYNKVQIKLTTHDANGVTVKDFELAKLIDNLV